MDLKGVHVMSLGQLDELWKYESFLMSLLFDQPLRTCNAKPNDLPEVFPPMSPDKFRVLKRSIRMMWVTASHYWKCRVVEGKGLGIFIPGENDDGYPKQTLLSPTKPTVLGWIVKAPSDDQCPTSHRYLRSPVEGSSCYLGGPISLANRDPVDRVCVQLSKERNMAIVTSKPGRRMVPGGEILWSYKLAEKCEIKMYAAEDWFHEDNCCRQEMLPESVFAVSRELPVGTAQSSSSDEPPQKKGKRIVGGMRPLTKSQNIGRFCLCTYCGMNIDHQSKHSPNLKRHVSLYHAMDVVREMDMDPLDDDNPIQAKDFVLHVDKVDNVLDGLHRHFFNYQPASSFLKNFKEEVTFKEGEDVEKEKERVFALFLQESKCAFSRYQVIYLKGIKTPAKYEDLLPCKSSGFDNVIWCGEKPSNTNFSVNQYSLNEEEKQVQKRDILLTLQDCTVAQETEYVQGLCDL